MIEISCHETAVTLNLVQGLTILSSKIKMLKQVQHDGFVQGAAS
jgi:hypothetical protein